MHMLMHEGAKIGAQVQTCKDADRDGYHGKDREEGRKGGGGGRERRSERE